MYVFALEEVPGNCIKFPKLTWAFCKILAATPSRDKAFTLDVDWDPETLRSFCSSALPFKCKVFAGVMLPLAEHSGLVRLVDRCISPGCFLTMGHTANTWFSSALWPLSSLWNTLSTGVPNHKDVMLPLHSLLSNLSQLNFTLPGLSLWDSFFPALTDSETSKKHVPTVRSQLWRPEGCVCLI